MIRAAMRELLKRKRGEDLVMSLMPHIFNHIYILYDTNIFFKSNLIPDMLFGES